MKRKPVKRILGWLLIIAGVVGESWAISPPPGMEWGVSLAHVQDFRMIFLFAFLFGLLAQGSGDPKL